MSDDHESIEREADEAFYALRRSGAAPTDVPGGIELWHFAWRAARDVERLRLCEGAAALIARWDERGDAMEQMAAFGYAGFENASTEIRRAGNELEQFVFNGGKLPGADD